jgi:hypothetical protein
MKFDEIFKDALTGSLYGTPGVIEFKTSKTSVFSPKFKTGDEVVIIDGSYSLKWEHGIAKHGATFDDHKLTFKVVTQFERATLPSRNLFPDQPEHNDTIIQRGDSIIFIQARFLKPAKCPECGHSNARVQ